MIPRTDGTKQSLAVNEMFARLEVHSVTQRSRLPSCGYSICGLTRFGQPPRQAGTRSFKRPVTSVSFEVSTPRYQGTSILDYLSKVGGSHRGLVASSPIDLIWHPCHLVRTSSTPSLENPEGYHSKLLADCLQQTKKQSQTQSQMQSQMQNAAHMHHAAYIRYSKHV